MTHIKFDKILVIEAHPDDGVFGCGGSMLRFKNEGSTIWDIYFCPCDEDPKNKGHLDDHRAILKEIGIEKLIENDFKRDILEVEKQRMRNIMFNLRNEYQPDLVMCPSTHDFHQDHKIVADCAATIFRDSSTILSYEVIRSVMPDFRPNFFVDLDFNKAFYKLKLCQKYISQRKNRPYCFNDAAIMSPLEFRGSQIRSRYAEAFEMVWGKI